MFIYTFLAITWLLDYVLAHISIYRNSPLAQTDMYFVTFGSCNPTIGSHWLTHTIKIIVSLLLANTFSCSPLIGSAYSNCHYCT